MALSLEQLCKRAGERVVVEVSSLSIAPGGFLSILGNSEPCASTLLRLIGGLETPTTGVVTLDGRTLGAETLEERAMDHLILPDMRDRLTAYGRAPSTLPRILLIDEGVRDTGSGRLSVQEKRDTFEGLRQREVTVIYATDDQSLALAISDQVAVLADGRLVQVDRPAELLRRPHNTFVATHVGLPPMNVMPAVLEKDGCAVQVGPRGVQLPGEITETFCRDVFLGVRPDHLRLRRDPSAGWPGQVASSTTRAGRTYADIAVDGARFLVLDQLDPPAEPGDRVGINVRATDLLVFDEQGDRLEIR